MAQATYYQGVDIASAHFEPVAKQGKLYVANLTEPLLVETPPVQLATSFDPEVPFLHIKPQGAFADFLATAERHILDRCIAHKAEWFRKELDDDALRHNFKSFFRDGEFKVKAQEAELAVFGVDRCPAAPVELVAGRHVRCVLELARVCFGRQEFGAMWRLAQARVVEVPPCMLADDRDASEADTDVGEDDHPDTEGGVEAQEFL